MATRKYPTVEDYLTKDMDTLIKDITTNVITKKDVVIAKKKLHNYFVGNEQAIKAGYSFKLDNTYNLSIFRNLKGTGRITFKFANQPVKFSVQLSYLTGKKESFPFKKTDKVVYGNDIWTVKGIAPASRRVIIELDGTVKSVRVNSLTKFYEEEI